MRLRLLTAAMLAVGLISQFGCERREGDRTGGTTRDSGDQTFVTTAAQANLAEVEAGRLASDRSTSVEVKSFAEHMINDHSQANRELTDLARRKGFTIPESANDAQQQELGRLKELNGAEFDKKYAALMVADHVKAVALFEENAKTAKDPDVRDFAGKLAPKLGDHLKMARDLNGKLGGTPAAD